MKIYNKQDFLNNYFTAVFAFIWMTLINISMFFYTIHLFLTKHEDFVGSLILTISIIFIDVFTIKSRGKKLMTLVRKDNVIENGKEKCNLIFVLSKYNVNRKHTKPVYCYTYEKNNLEINKDYIVTISYWSSFATKVEETTK